MKILFLCKKQYHDYKMSRSRIQYVNALAKVAEVVCDGPGFPTFSSAPASVDQYKPDFVIWYKPLSIPGYMDIPEIPKVLIYNEMYRVKEVTKEIASSGTRTMICHHANDIALFKMDPKYRFIHVPHHIDPGVFRDRGVKDIDVLLAGIIASRVYPFRARLEKFMHSGRLKHRRLFHYEHPGYRILNPMEQLDSFADALSRSRIVLTCSSSFKYALAKYPEIMACRSAVAGDIPDERQEWFRQNLIELTPGMPDKQIEDVLESYLSNEEKLRAVTDSGYNYTQENFNILRWTEKFMEIVRCAT